jgi:hypothetical protein
LLRGKAGAKPVFSDSEMLTLMVAQDFLPYGGETQYMAYIRANYQREIPQVVEQSPYNRRARALWRVLEALREAWVRELGAWTDKQLLLDTKPVPVVGYTRSQRPSDFAGCASYGYCAARQLHYFGFKLVALTTLDGLPRVYDLVPANTDARLAAACVLCRVQDCDIFADKGFIGQAWQAEVRCAWNNRIWTTQRTNQARQNTPAFDALLTRVRERIESTFHQLQNTGRHLEHLLAKTLHGLRTRLVTKLAALTLRYLLHRRFNLVLLSFSISH